MANQYALLPDDVPVVAPDPVTSVIAEGDQPVIPAATTTPETPTPPAEVQPAVTDAPPAPEASPSPQSDPAIEQLMAAREQAIAAREAEVKQLADQAAAQMQQLQYAQQQAQLAQQQQEVASVLEQRRRELSAKGYRETEIDDLIDHERELHMKAVQAETSAAQQDQIRQGRHLAAMHFAKQYGIPYNDIAQMNSPQEMESAGRSYTANLNYQQQIAKLQEQVKELTQASVPPGGTFEGGASSVSELSGEALERAVGENRISLTPDVEQRLREYYKSQGFGG